jgi:hypothetical protein
VALTNQNIPYREVAGTFVIVDPRNLDSVKLAGALSELNKKLEFVADSSVSAAVTSGPVKYIVDDDGAVRESTTAAYWSAIPSVKFPPEGLGFDILITTNFGLKAYYVDASGKVISEGGEFNTAFYAAAIDRTDNRELLLVTAPGLSRIYEYEKNSGKLSVLIEGYSVTSMKFWNDNLYFAGYKDPEDWDNARLYEYSLQSREIRILTGPIFADVRGLSFIDGRIIVSDGRHNRLVILDAENFDVINYWYGFNYPNGTSPTIAGNLLVADEHAGVVREVNLRTFQEMRSVGFRLLRSPGYAEEITSGEFRGFWIIADTDNDRILLIDPSNERIHAEMTGLRGVLNFSILAGASK